MGSKAFIIDGNTHAHVLQDEIKTSTRRLMTQHGIIPGLAIIRVGDHPASELYVSSKGRQARSVGFQFEEFYFPSSAEPIEIVETIHSINDNPSFHGVIVQLPLPAHFDKLALLRAVDPRKDVDGLHPLNLGKLWQGDPSGFVPCTPQGCKILLDQVHSSLAGKDILIIGCSTLVGRPMAGLLLNSDATITLAHSHTRRLPELCKRAEIMIVAIGDPQFIRGDWVRPGATVLDVGINRRASGKVVGDVDFDNAVGVAGAITPVPGGVGPMTVASLLNNTLIAAERSVFPQTG